METCEPLLFMLKTNQQVIKKLIDDITEDESMARGKDGHNHIRWHVGHMLYFNGYTAAILGDESEDIKSLKNDFAGGSEVSDDRTAYPSMAELRNRLYNVYDRLTGVIKKASESDLAKGISEGDEEEAKEGEEKEKKEKKRFPVWQQLTWAVMHDFYHAGQIVQTRRTLGRERPFE